MKNNHITSFLIVKLSSIGDVVLTTPVLTIIKQHFPKSTITFLVEKESSFLLQEHPLIDTLIIFDRTYISNNILKHPVKSLQHLFDVIKRIRCEKFTYSIDFQGLLRSALFVLISRAKIKAGRGRWLFFNKRIPMYRKDRIQHAVENYFDTINLTGIQPNRNEKLQISIPLKAEQRVIELLYSFNINQNKKVIGIVHSTRWKTKCYPTKHFSTLINEIHKTLDTYVILIGAKSEKDRAAEIMDGCNKKPYDTTGLLALDETTALIKRCDVIITSDSGPMHIACALDKPLIALFGPTDPRKTGPWGCRSIVLKSELNCIPCLKRKCKISPNCMELISPHYIVDNLKSIIL